MTETFVQNLGLNPRIDWDIEWEKRLMADGPIAVYFEPFEGIYPVYCSCYRKKGEYLVLKIPPKDCRYGRALTDWFPVTGGSWVVVPEIFVYPQ